MKKMNYYSEFKTKEILDRVNNQKGVTLIELMLVLATSMLILAAVYVLFISQQRHYVAQSDVTEMQQNIRAGSAIMQADLRMVGFSPTEKPQDSFKLIDITNRDLDYNTLNVNGDSTIQYYADINEDGKLDDPDEVYTFSLSDYPDNTPADRDGMSDLTRTTQTPVVNNRELIAENIEAMAIAYASDADGDGNLDLSTNGNVIWGIDTNNDNILDRALDTDDDGDIDVNDAVGGTDILANPFNVGSAPELPQIRAARVFILAQAEDDDVKFTNGSTYVLAGRHITPADNYRRRLLEFTIYFRNTGL